MLSICGLVGYPQGHRQPTNAQTLKEKWLSFPNNHQHPISSQVGSGLPTSIPSTLEFLSGCTCAGNHSYYIAQAMTNTC